MVTDRLKDTWQTLEGEHLKTGAELAVRWLGRAGAAGILRGGENIVDDRLTVDIGGITLINPVMVGGGWDKKGWAADGLYDLGFSADEVGSVPLYPQIGNPRPRLFYDTEHNVALNRFGFNSIGAYGVAEYLRGQKREGTVRISLTVNKETPEDEAPGHMAEVAEILHEFADYYVINFTSPNTPGLRDMMLRQLREDRKS